MQAKQRSNWPTLTLDEQANLIFQNRTTLDYIHTIQNTGYHELSEQMHDQLLNPTMEDIRYFCREHPRRAYKATRKILARDIIQQAVCDGQPPRAVCDYLQSIGETLTADTPADMIEELIMLNKFGYEGSIVYVILHGFKPLDIPADDRAATDEELKFLEASNSGDVTLELLVNLRYYLDFVARHNEIPADMLARWVDYTMWADMESLKRQLLQYPECNDSIFYYINNSIIMHEIIHHVMHNTA